MEDGIAVLDDEIIIVINLINLIIVIVINIKVISYQLPHFYLSIT